MLSQILIQATRKRDEALMEASKLKYSMAELEKKLNKLDVYCHNLKSGLDECNRNSPYRMGQTHKYSSMIQQFLASVSESRSSTRLLSRSLTMQLRHMGSKPYDMKISHSKNPRSLLLYLEALNKAFFEDFESTTNYKSFNELQGLAWEEVLNKGTRHFSEEFSQFCASKSLCLVHLLANSVHPGLPIFRVDKGARFDSVYMEDMDGERAKKLVPSMVRILITPGFYVYGNVVKCKVICRYSNNVDSSLIDKGLTSSFP
ncbi:hypothetical protein ES332_A08G203800v1 [Gossypium tomentosum]|uniref:GIL1/IRKI C-terminal domain-containing protein n=1 Tax=Gossypium tomentosum TaxID=34277 RepID=A0A5D2PI59_GOSTO|nr:hypothetical protein ES332_A08G203800v1 [Gossypium tomentosum]